MQRQFVVPSIRRPESPARRSPTIGGNRQRSQSRPDDTRGLLSVWGVLVILVMCILMLVNSRSRPPGEPGSGFEVKHNEIDLYLDIRPKSYSDAKVISPGVSLLITLENPPVGAEVSWESSDKAAISRQSGNSVEFVPDSVGLHWPEVKATSKDGVAKKSLSWTVANPTIVELKASFRTRCGQMRSRPRRIQEALIYRSAVKEMRLTNPYASTIIVESLRFHVRDFQADRRPVLIYQVFPFFDVLAVRLVNVGWGPFDGGTLRLFTDDQKAAL